MPRPVVHFEFVWRRVLEMKCVLQILCNHLYGGHSHPIARFLLSPCDPPSPPRCEGLTSSTGSKARRDEFTIANTTDLIAIGLSRGTLSQVARHALA
jgi:hypothetical protein